MGAFLYASVAILIFGVLLLIYMITLRTQRTPRAYTNVQPVHIGGSITPADIAAITAVPPPVPAIVQPAVVPPTIVQPAPVQPAPVGGSITPADIAAVIAVPPPAMPTIIADPVVATTNPVVSVQPEQPSAGIVGTIINTVSSAFSGDCESNKDKILAEFVESTVTTYTPSITVVRKISDDVCEADIALANKSTGFVESTVTYRFKFANNSDPPTMSFVSMVYHELPAAPFVAPVAAPPTPMIPVVDSLSKFTKQVGKWFNMNINQTAERVSEIQCIDRCLDMGTKCVAVNYWPPVSRCNFISEYGGQTLYDNKYVSFYLKK